MVSVLTKNEKEVGLGLRLSSRKAGEDLERGSF